MADYLDSQSTAVTLGTNLFYGLVRAPTTQVPNECIFVLGTGGRSPSRTFGGQATAEIRYASVQVTVRSSGFASGLGLARTVYSKVQSATSLSTSVTYMDVRALQAEPIYLQQDERGQHFWTLNFEAVYTSTG